MRAIVVGGGLSGLVVAHGLLHRGHQVVVVDPGDSPGGLIRARRVGGFLCETGPQGILDGAPEVRALIQQLGLTDRLVTASARARRRYVYLRGKLRAVPTSPPALLASDLLSWGGRLRLLREPLVRTRPPDGEESVLAFAERRIGPEAARALAAPAVIGIFAGDAATLSMRSAFPRLAEGERVHGSLFAAMKAARREGRSAGKLVSFIDGLQELPLALAASLGASLVRGSVTGIERIGTRWRVRTDEAIDQLDQPADALVLACPLGVLADLLAPLAAEAAAALQTIPLAPAAVVCLGYHHNKVGMDLDAYGFLVARGENRALLGCQYESSVFPGRAPAGGVLLRAIYGGTFHPELVEAPDDVLVDRALIEIGAMAGLSGRPDLRAVFRHKGGIPQYDLQHPARMAALDAALAALPGLHATGYGLKGVGLSDCVRNATHLAAQLSGQG